MPLQIIPATAAVPPLSRLLITTIEPALAVSGALLAFRQPRAYLSTMTRRAGTFSSDTVFLYTELGGAWLYFAFVEAVVLRLYDDLWLWRLLCAGMLLSDAAYCHSAAQAVGGWGSWVTFEDWTVEDWVVLITTAPMVLARLLLVLGVGVRTPAQAIKTRSDAQ